VSDRIRLRDGAVEWRELDGEIVALDRQRSEYLAVNRTGAAVWPLLAQGASREELLERMTERFDVDGEIAERDLQAFLDSLVERELLEP
jgi:hypothetical protein